MKVGGGVKRAMPLWREPIIVLGAVLGAMVLAQLLSFRWYQWKGERFCDALEVGLPLSSLLQRGQAAKMEWLVAEPLGSGLNGKATFITDRAPWYRYVCRVHIVEGRVASATLEPGD